MGAEILAPELPPETQKPLQKPLPQAAQSRGQNPSPIPEWQRETILAAMDGKLVEGNLDLVWEMLKDMFSLTAVWKESDLSLTEIKRRKKGGGY